MQAYSRLYYSKKLKTIVDAKWTQYIAKNPHLKSRNGEALRHRNCVLAELLNAETDEVKAEVERRREEGLFSEDEDVDHDDDAVDGKERQRRATARGFHRKVLLHI